METRRSFIKKSAAGVAGFAALSSTGAFGAIGANNRLNVAILGTGGRAHGLAKSIGLAHNVKLTHICDVDQNRVLKFNDYCLENLGYKAETEGDFRNILDNKDVDAVFIATPEHWHAPMAIMAMDAGKHVYVEKPCSHNPHETELLVKAQKKYGKQCQMGNQQRSALTSITAMKEISEGIIGNVYAGRAFYARQRGSIGKGNVVAAPSTLDWDLWQGPAPREDYRDNVHPYNWHWFRTWGTGEIHNNGTHEIDVCRWALGVKYPVRVVSMGGKLSLPNDDWEWFDTQHTNFEFEGGKMITWNGLSNSGFDPRGGRGVHILGTNGSIHLNRSVYKVFDLKGELVKAEKEEDKGAAKDQTDTIGFDGLTIRHVDNLANAIRDGVELNAPIHDASISTQLCHLGNIALDVKDSLEIDPKTGHILNNKEAQSYWKRTYQSGWEPKV